MNHRRTFRALAVMTAGFAAGAAPGQAVDPSTLAGKVVCGYQGWFACPGDGSDAGVGWFHWSKDRANPPRAGNYTMDMWPDVSDCDAEELFAVPGLTLTDGSPARLYSPRTPKTVERHFKWMKEAGIDGVFWQRFITDITSPTILAHRNAVMQNVRGAANTWGRVFAIEYDCNGAANTTLFNNLANDWRMLVDTYHITSDPRYLRHKGKPVIIVWGLGFKGIDNTPATAAQIINFLRNDPVYGGNCLIGGVPSYWRTLSGDSQTDAAWAGVYRSWDVIHPWTVGRYRTTADVQAFKTSVWAPDVAEARNLGIDYLPVVWPGFSWDNLQGYAAGTSLISRQNGGFLWSQIHAVQDAGANMMFNAMFDEVNEGTATYKIADAHPPSDNWITNSGYPRDWYLRLLGTGRQMMAGDLPLTPTIPIDPACGGEAVSFNLGEDQADRLTHVQVADGDTVADLRGGKSCRRNVNPAQDFYFYFAVDDAFAFQGGLPDLCVSIDYYDTGTGSLSLQYDGISAAYRNGGSVTLGNTGKWLRKVFHVTDAYFANRQNNGADFRIAGAAGATFYLDRVLVTSSRPRASMIRVAPSATSHRVSPGQGLAAEEITISSEGPGAVNYTIVATVPWLSVTPASGRNTGEVDHLALQYDAAGLAAGVHTGSVRVLDPAAANSPQTVKVTITVESRCDHDHDGDVDQSDFGYLQSCLTDGLGTPEPPCIDADLNGDNHVDLEDFDLLVECMGGPDSPIAVTCSR